ncbi:MAG: uroporphyrinogen-III synthase [Bacteroidetes bacterium]|nr:uroporphyrinogen-III synthase [Bacteroidota bacterium]
MKVKSILVSQPKPETEKSPYFDLAQKYNIKVDFRPFIHIEGIEAKDFRKDRISILDHTAVILTSRSAADHYFRICQEMRISVPESMKYFCISESTAYYLQKYVQYRKRKIFNGKQTFHDLAEVIKKHREENYLLPCSDIHKDEISDFLDTQNIRYTKAVMFKTVSSNLQDLKNVNYDVLVFFSPSGIKSLFKNFPGFKQNQTRIAAFGPATAKAVEDAHLKLNIYAPTPQAPSMTMALENYIKNPNETIVVPPVQPVHDHPVVSIRAKKVITVEKPLKINKTIKPVKEKKISKGIKLKKVAKKVTPKKLKTSKKAAKPVKSRKAGKSSGSKKAKKRK